MLHTFKANALKFNQRKAALDSIPPRGPRQATTATISSPTRNPLQPARSPSTGKRLVVLRQITTSRP